MGNPKANTERLSFERACSSNRAGHRSVAELRGSVDARVRQNAECLNARVTATPAPVIKQYEFDSPKFDDSDFNFSAETCTSIPDEEKKALVIYDG
ncbi:MAG: hypothetical protein WAM53_01790 [Terrimicrobiaceae bacterium]